MAIEIAIGIFAYFYSFLTVYLLILFGLFCISVLMMSIVDIKAKIQEQSLENKKIK